MIQGWLEVERSSLSVSAGVVDTYVPLAIVKSSSWPVPLAGKRRFTSQDWCRYCFPPLFPRWGRFEEYQFCSCRYLRWRGRWYDVYWSIEQGAFLFLPPGNPKKGTTTDNSLNKTSNLDWTINSSLRSTQVQSMDSQLGVTIWSLLRKRPRRIRESLPRMSRDEYWW